MISFNEEKFKESYKENPDITKRWFETTFTKLKNDFDRTITDDKSNLSILDKIRSSLSCSDWCCSLFECFSISLIITAIKNHINKLLSGIGAGNKPTICT